jgi:hypothetical protein
MAVIDPKPPFEQRPSQRLLPRSNGHSQKPVRGQMIDLNRRRR